MKPAVDSSDAEIEALSAACERLVNFGARCTPEYADGLLTAVATGLTLPPLPEVLRTLAGDEFERVFADPDDVASAERVFGGRLAVLRGLLDAESLDERPDELRLAPIMEVWTDEGRAEVAAAATLSPEEAAGLVTGAGWADGFFAGVQAFAAHWPDAGDEDTELLHNLMQQVHALRLPEGSAELAQHLQIVYGKDGADRDQLIDSACFAIQDMRLWCVDHAPLPETRRVGKTPGRNDPCPCGSGKKYKKCHGAA
jgi:uncharacterized protein